MPTEAEVYTFPFRKFPDILHCCLTSAAAHYRADHSVEVAPEPVDVRMWIQKWKTNTCGFGDAPGEPQITLAPTVIVEYHRKLRYVFHNAKFAYALRGETSVEYYNRCVTRSFPGANDRGVINYLTA